MLVDLSGDVWTARVVKHLQRLPVGCTQAG